MSVTTVVAVGEGQTRVNVALGTAVFVAGGTVSLGFTVAVAVAGA